MSFRSDLTSGTSGTFSSQFTFDASKRTITLQNGRTFAIEVTEGDKTKQVGANNEELLTLVKDILEHVSHQQQFTFTDLSKTSITYEGVKTDQKDVSQEIKVYSDQTYSEKYHQISRVAHQTLANVSVPQRGSVLQPADSERIGSDATPPGAIQRDESTRERTATVIDTSDQDESSIPVIESSGESPSDDEDLFITVSGTAAKMKGPTQVRFKEILNTPVATETQKTNKNEPGKLKQIWTSILNFFSSGTMVST